MLTCKKQFIRKSELMHFSFLDANVPIVSHMLSSDRTQARARSPSGAAPGTVKDAQPACQPVGLCSSSANDSTLTRSSVLTTTRFVDFRQRVSTYCTYCSLMYRDKYIFLIILQYTIEGVFVYI